MVCIHPRRPRCSITTGRAHIVKEEKACAGLADDTACDRGSRGSGGRLTGSLNLSNVRLVPGATSAPSRACLPANSSTIWTSLTALAARRSTSPVRSRRLLLALKFEACSAPGMLWSTNDSHSPASKLLKRSSNRFLGTNPPRGGRCSSILGINKNNFHALTPRVSYPCARAAMHSSNATLSAAVKTPFKKVGTVRMTMISCTLTLSKLAMPTATARTRTCGTSWTPSISTPMPAADPATEPQSAAKLIVLELSDSGTVPPTSAADPIAGSY